MIECFIYHVTVIKSQQRYIEISQLELDAQVRNLASPMQSCYIHVLSPAGRYTYCATSNFKEGVGWSLFFVIPLEGFNIS